MSQRVVHCLEAVQIQERHRQALTPSNSLGHGLVQAVSQQQPVGQAGQDIKVGNVLQLGLVLLQGRDV